MKLLRAAAALDAKPHGLVVEQAVAQLCAGLAEMPPTSRAVTASVVHTLNALYRLRHALSAQTWRPMNALIRQQLPNLHSWRLLNKVRVPAQPQTPSLRSTGVCCENH